MRMIAEAQPSDPSSDSSCNGEWGDYD